MSNVLRRPGPSLSCSEFSATETDGERSSLLTVQMRSLSHQRLLGGRPRMFSIDEVVPRMARPCPYPMHSPDCSIEDLRLSHAGSDCSIEGLCLSSAGSDSSVFCSTVDKNSNPCILMGGNEISSFQSVLREEVVDAGSVKNCAPTQAVAVAPPPVHGSFNNFSQKNCNWLQDLSFYSEFSVRWKFSIFKTLLCGTQRDVIFNKDCCSSFLDECLRFLIFAMKNIVQPLKSHCFISRVRMIGFSNARNLQSVEQKLSFFIAFLKARIFLLGSERQMLDSAACSKKYLVLRKILSTQECLLSSEIVLTKGGFDYFSDFISTIDQLINREGAQGIGHQLLIDCLKLLLLTYEKIIFPLSEKTLLEKVRTLGIERAKSCSEIENSLKASIVYFTKLGLFVSSCSKERTKSTGQTRAST